MDFLPETVSTGSFENSPAESLMSAPSDNYTSLFAASTPANPSDNTMDPMEMMTPQSFTEDRSKLSPVAEAEEGTPSPEDGDKKTTKKRKSWGQVLPEPKTNLPPRKRAKTDDEKEQRRVERVLRNRRAAQSSRERKRLEVEALEKRNKQLEDLLINAQKANLMLVEELNRFRRDSGVVTRTSTPLDPLRNNPLTLSQELFSSQAGQKLESEQANPALMADLMNPTVNPASLSPELAPLSEEAEPTKQTSADAESSEQTSTSTDLTQRPAVMLCDLPCQTSVELPKSFLNSQTPSSPLLALSLQFRMMLLSASAILSACQRPLTQIAISSKAGFSLLPSPQLLTTIIWLVTIPPASRISPTSTSSTSTTSSPTTKQTPPSPTLWQRATTTPLRTTASTSRSSTLRLKSLRKILSSSPSLARPLMDATMVALRLVSEGRDDRVETLRSESSATRDVDRELTECLRGITLPSREVLMTLMWALKVEERRIQRKSDAILDPESSATSAAYSQPKKNHVVLNSNGAGMKRMSEDVAASGGLSKRYRMA